MRLVEATHHGVSTVVRTKHGRTDEFPIKVGLHQGLGLIPFLFIVVLDAITEEFTCGLPVNYCLLTIRYRGGVAEEMAWLSDWNGEQGTKSQHRQNGSNGQ